MLVEADLTLDMLVSELNDVEVHKARGQSQRD